MKLSIPDFILSIKPYSPGKPIEELEREYGITDAVKLASNENPLGPSPMAVKAIQGAIGKLNRYPDGSGHYLVRKLSEKLGVLPGNILLGNGSDEVIGILTRTLLNYGDEVIIPKPSFLIYDIMVRSVGATPVYAPLQDLSIDLAAIKERISSKTKMVFLTNPNNPTGTLFSRENFENFLDNIPSDVVVVVDEAYIEYVRDKNCPNSLDFLGPERAVVILRTFSKVYGLAGLRIGYGIMPEELTELLNRVRLPFNANSLAQVAAIAALDDKEFFSNTVKLVHEGLDFLYDSLDGLGIKYFPTEANFFLIDVGKDADDVFESMLKEGVIVRSMKSYGYPLYIRVNAGLPEENIRFVKALEKVIL